MFAFIQYVRAVTGRFFASDEAQDAFEYLLVIGGVTVAVILAIATPAGGAMVRAVVDGVCTAIDTIPSITLSDCTT